MKFVWRYREKSQPTVRMVCNPIDSKLEPPEYESREFPLHYEPGCVPQAKPIPEVLAFVMLP
jgi:hypothetical protein